jgi:hypothetical protein
MPDLTVPAGDGEAAILDEGRRGRGAGAKQLELIEGDIADADQPRFARGMQPFHGAPYRQVGRREPDAARRPVEHVGIEGVDVQMLEGPGERLAHLGSIVGVGIVGQAMVLPAPRRELRLDEELGARDHSRGDRPRDPRAHSRFVVVAPLIRGVDAAEAGFERQTRQPLGGVFLPGGAVDEAWHADASDLELTRDHARIISSARRPRPPGADLCRVA